MNRLIYVTLYHLVTLYSLIMNSHTPIVENFVCRSQEQDANTVHSDLGKVSGRWTMGDPTKWIRAKV